MLPEVVLLDPARAGGLAVDLLELGDAVLGVLGGLGRVVARGVRVGLAAAAAAIARGERREGRRRRVGAAEGEERPAWSGGEAEVAAPPPGL